MSKAPDTAALSGLPVLLIDCQSTGANPAHGQLTEIAWARATADGELAAAAIATHRLALQSGAEVPARVTRLTGLSADDLADGTDRPTVWRELVAALDPAGDPPVAAVIHFARFERPFLDDIARRGAGRPFPLPIICTYEIARRTLPGLPRHGLRAVAGYLGFPLGELRRAADHVRATAHVWVELVRRLAAEHGVVDRPGLEEFLARDIPARSSPRELPLPRERRAALPDRPGVYRFLDATGRVLYVGKATSLRRRVGSYFGPRSRGSSRTLEMLTQARDVAPTETATALEAALLEVDEIKRLDPPYNVALRERAAPALEPRELLDQIVSLLAAVNAEDEDLPTPGALEHPEPPTTKQLRRGARRFLAAYLGPGAAPVRRATLLALGGMLWRWPEQRARDAEAADAGDRAEPGSAEEDEREEWRWTAGRVARALARSVTHLTHLERRGRWLEMLRTCTVRWRPAAADEDERELTMGSGAPDLDRLRVLNTELRRLVSAGSLVELRLGPGARLTPQRLDALLAWL